MNIGITFDCGPLVALESRNRRILTVLANAKRDGVIITVPAVVLAEWWRGDPRQATILASITIIEPTSGRIAQLAGEAIKAIPSATPIDAIVMASAAQRGDIVYTDDVKDLQTLQTYFPAVSRVLHS